MVPLKQNSAELVARYKAAGQGNAVTLIVAEGQGHNYWEGFFRCQPLVDFVIARSKGEVTTSNRTFRRRTEFIPFRSSEPCDRRGETE